MVARSALRLHSAAAAAAGTASASASSGELARFARLAHEWSDEAGAFRALYSMNELRVPWIADETMRGMKQASAKRAAVPLRVLDVGCGGGILSVALARRGLAVRGVDACAESIAVARETAKTGVISDDLRARLQFDVVAENGGLGEGVDSGGYDAVVASEVVEHVDSVPAFVDSLVQAAKPGAPIFLTTINRTTLSRVAAIWLAEEVLRIVPSGMHDWRKFVKPEELSAELEQRGCKVEQVLGMDYNPVFNRWKWTECTQINYALMARRIL
ncbi:hypothetical protein PFISCL1PPCAC_17484 [Pristionchus fissidentatus]|uniref:Ubiquinone biosynthesis O-methyltransferase, mitochondrial n=1 Tax=Pristionchus fissidentatus TaxID=1538716 RepID=A0AAV5W7Y4_9BILA|nr:hypothetical protein PFISCL1PPCAC_17484 [Pristionchus fissidentatus]